MNINYLHTLSTANIFAQMNTSNGLNSLADACKSFNTYGKIPTLNAKLTAHGPRSKNLPKSAKALNLCTYCTEIKLFKIKITILYKMKNFTCDRSTCNTIGSCSGGLRSSHPRSNHT